MKRLGVIMAIWGLFCCGCAEGRFLGKEGRLYYGIPFGQDSSDLAARKNIPMQFGLVKPGMAKKEVLEKFGEPSSIAMSKDNYWIWYYKSARTNSPLNPVINDVYIYLDDYKVINPPQ